MNKSFTLVTGASRGIGLELARRAALDGSPLILSGRDERRLDEIAREFTERYGVEVMVLPGDLVDRETPGRLFDAIRESGHEVGTLINNAGFGGFGLFHELDLRDQLDMIRVNVSALVELTHLLLPSMIERGRGRILNVGSLAGFQPGPLMATYYATKAFVLHFSEALDEELRGTGVRVSALCPGPVATGFQERASMQESNLNRFAGLDVAAVAKMGYERMKAGRRITIPGFANRALVAMIRLSPRGMVTRVVKNLNKSR